MGLEISIREQNKVKEIGLGNQVRDFGIGYEIRGVFGLSQILKRIIEYIEFLFLNSKIVCFHPFCFGILFRIVCFDPKIVCFNPKIVCFNPKIVCFAQNRLLSDTFFKNRLLCTYQNRLLCTFGIVCFQPYSEYRLGGFNEFDIHGPPLASWRGLCEIDRVQFRVTQKNFKNLGSPSIAELNRYLSSGKTQIIVIILPCQDFPNF